MATTPIAFTEQQSKEICEALNNQHATALHALALTHAQQYSQNIKVSYVKLSSICCDGFKLSYVECEDSMCKMVSADLAFTSPLRSVDDAIPMILKEGHKAFAPQRHWLVSEPMSLVILFLMAALGFVTLIGGEACLKNLMELFPLLKKFGSTKKLFWVVKSAFYSAIAAHVLEAVYVAHEFKKRLNLNNKAIMEWFLMISCVGYPVTKKGLELIQVAKDQKSEKSA